jgi:hypothetical protein
MRTGWLAVALVVCAGCISEQATSDETAELVGCPGEGSSVYTPFTSGSSPTGTVAEYPWRGTTSSYPDGVEDFRGYSSLPTTVECSNNKGQRNYLDVTDGCLSAVAISNGEYTRGQIHGDPSGYFRALALGHDDTDAPTKWTDQAVEYRFYYSKPTGDISYPGFKAFARYRTEYDLYVASWRMDGVAQIQKKQCGNYTILKLDKTYGAPSPNAWHTIKFVANGNKLDLYLDGDHAISTTDDTFTWGTAGMRIDSMDNSYIDDWKIEMP